MQKRIKLFHALCVLIFVTTAGFKLLSLSGRAGILNAADGLTGIPNRWLYLLVAGIELGIASYLIWGRINLVKSGLLIWMGMNFATYRFGRWWLEIPESCSCLGSLTDWFPPIKPFVDPIMLAIVVLILTGGLLSLWVHWREYPNPLQDKSDSMTNIATRENQSPTR